MRTILITILLTAALAMPAAAGLDGGTQSPFALGAGSRSLALGGANMAAGEEAYAPFWNASRLAWAERFTVSGFHSRLFDSDVAYQYLGVVAPTTDFGVFAVGVFRLGIDGIERRDASNVLLGDFDDSRLRFILAYGRELGGYDVGLALTLERHSLESYNATSSPGVNVAAGRRFRPNSRHVPLVAISAQVSNLIRPKMELALEEIKYPMALDIGMSAELQPGATETHTVTVSAAMNKTDGVGARLAAGLEYSYDRLVFLRGGVRDARLSVGGGLVYAGFGFDYALVDRDLGSVHMFTLTSQFGKAVSERRLERAAKREAEFNQLMAVRLQSRNRTMVDGLVKQAVQESEAGDLTAALDHYGRALFLARSGGLDTTTIHTQAAAVRDRIEEINRTVRYAAYIDSARVRFDANDFVAARYYAGLAREQHPKGPEAARLYDDADDAILAMTTRVEVVTSRLLAVDSMLAYGQVDEAYTTVQSLHQIAGDDPRVQQAVRKVDFELLMRRASTAHGRGDGRTALAALDSALAIFPGHQWCLNLKHEISRQARVAPTPKATPEPAGPAPLSDEIRREVQQSYRTAQDYFTAGDLSQAIRYWEKVERLAPDYENVRDYLVKAYKFVGVELYGQNNLQEAISVWRKAAMLQPGNEEIAGYIKRTESEIQKLKELSYEHE